MHRINNIQYGKRSAKFTGAILWNNLDSPMREAPSRKMFKKTITRILLVILYRLRLGAGVWHKVSHFAWFQSFCFIGAVF